MRTDIHRKGAIIPADYEHVLSYNGSHTQDGWPIPSFGINCELDRRKVTVDARGSVTHVENGKHAPDGRCCIVGLRNVARVKWASHGSTGRCTACGAHFVYGEVWKHRTTGEHIHLGHICGAKYGFLMDRSAFEMEADRRAATIIAKMKREQNAQDRAKFLDDHPGLERALQTDHHIVKDIARKFLEWNSLTDPQVELVTKLYRESIAPKECVHCKGDHDLESCPNRTPLEDGRQDMTGTILSTKLQDGWYGTTFKMLVLLDTGSKVWGTVPSVIDFAELKGSRVKFTGTIEVSPDDKYFGFFKRPAKAAILS